MCYEIELQQLQKCSTVLHGNRELETAPVPSPALFLFGDRLIFVTGDLQSEPQLIRGQRARCKASANLFEHPVQDECQRLEQLDSIFQFNGFLKFGCRFGGDKRALGASVGQFL